MSENKFGKIEGFPEGSVFEKRSEIKAAGLHNHLVNGISRVAGVGCDCIVLNGGYIDDQDSGDKILYTGEGGRKKNSTKHTFDQPFLRGNLDLSKNKYNGLPIRVIRGSKHFEKKYSPISGYRYDGLYYLDDYYAEEGAHGHRIWRYSLTKEVNTDLPPARGKDTPAPRRERTTNQPQRNPTIPQTLKMDYDFKCQVCDIRLEANGVPHAIGAHIKGLGTPHEGPDIRENMLILCPNCHYLFDAFAFSIADDFSLIGRDGNLTVNRNHNIELDFIRYHREKFEIASRI